MLILNVQRGIIYEEYGGLRADTSVYKQIQLIPIMITIMKTIMLMSMIMIMIM